MPLKVLDPEACGGWLVVLQVPRSSIAMRLSSEVSLQNEAGL